MEFVSSWSPGRLTSIFATVHYHSRGESVVIMLIRSAAGDTFTVQRFRIG
jgi:uncharacterized protein YjlB